VGLIVMSEPIPDFGDWGNGPDDEYTAPEQMRRIYFSFTAGPYAVWGTARVPPTWSMKEIRRHGMFQSVRHLSVSFDVLSLRALQEIGGNAAASTADTIPAPALDGAT
jgi:hypothetical protein